MATCSVQWWIVQKGVDPRTDQAKKGADSKLPGWQPNETATQLPQEGELSKQRGWHQRTKGRGPKKWMASRRRWLLLGCCGNCWDASSSSRACRAPQLMSYMASGSRYMSEQCVQRAANQMLASGLKLVSDKPGYFDSGRRLLTDDLSPVTAAVHSCFRHFRQEKPSRFFF